MAWRPRAPQPVVEEVGRRADLDGDDHGAVSREGVEVVDGLLERDHGAGAARVAHVHALDRGLETELRDQMRVQARAEASGARGRGEEVDVVLVPAGALAGAAPGLPA